MLVQTQRAVLKTKSTCKDSCYQITNIVITVIYTSVPIVLSDSIWNILIVVTRVSPNTFGVLRINFLTKGKLLQLLDQFKNMF